MKRNKKSAIVTARMMPEVKQRLQERARDAGMTLTQYRSICGLGQEIVRVEGLDAVLSELKAQGSSTFTLSATTSCPPCYTMV